MPKVRLDATGAAPTTLELSKSGDLNVTFESSLKGVKVTFAADSPFGETSFSTAGDGTTKSLRTNVEEGTYSYSYTWDDGTRDKPTRMADIDISK